MKNELKNNTKPNKKNVGSNESDFVGYPIYPASDDIYNKFKNENDIDPEHISQQKTPNETNDEVGLNDDEFGGDLDVPGGELDDSQEDIGNEDEENNYYSIGGDAHNDLEEDNGI